MDSAEPLSSILWTPPPHPGVIRCGGACRLPRVYRNIVSRIQVQIAYPQFRIWFECFVFGLRSFAFQLGCWAGIVRFSLLGGRDCLCLRLRGVWLWSIVGFALTAIGSILLAGNGMGNLCCSSLGCLKTV